MDLRKETIALMNKLEKPMNLNAQLNDLDISHAKGRYTKDEYDKYVEEIHLSIMASPSDLIVDIMAEFYWRFQRHFEIEELKEQ